MKLTIQFYFVPITHILGSIQSGMDYFTFVKVRIQKVFLLSTFVEMTKQVDLVNKINRKQPNPILIKLKPHIIDTTPGDILLSINNIHSK